MPEPDWVARWTAIGVGAVTVVNVFISGQAYRRTRPKIRVVIENAYQAKGHKSDSQNVIFVIRFANRGSTAIEVERLRLERCMRRFFVEDKKWTLIKAERLSEPPVVAPFGGVGHRVELDPTRVFRTSNRTHQRVRVTARLSDGKYVTSKQYRWKKLRKTAGLH